jgi:hypothetical protein
MRTNKIKIKQQIIATLVIVFMSMMIFGVVNTQNSSAANQANANLIQNFVAGSLSLEADATIGFADLSVGIAANSTQNLTEVNIRDYRGTGAGWSVTGLMNDLFNATAETGGRRNNIRNTSIAWFPGNGTLTGLESAPTTGIALGSNTFFSSAGKTLINASTNNGMGNYRFNLTPINIQYDGAGNQIPGNYQTWLRLTIS